MRILHVVNPYGPHKSAACRRHFAFSHATQEGGDVHERETLAFLMYAANFASGYYATECVVCVACARFISSLIAQATA